MRPPWQHTRLNLGRYCCGICHSGLFQKNLCVLVAQLCLTLCDPMDCSLAGSSVHGILQARILEWVVIPFSRRSSWPRDWTCISCIARTLLTLWATREALQSSLLLSSFSRVRPCATHRQQPTRLPHPSDSPGKNPGVGCHFLLQCMKVKSESEVTQSCPTLCNPTNCHLPGSSVHGIFQARVLECGAIAFSECVQYQNSKSQNRTVVLLTAWLLYNMCSLYFGLILFHCFFWQ